MHEKEAEARQAEEVKPKGGSLSKVCSSLRLTMYTLTLVIRSVE
jgi:hypothetical protein